MVSSLDEKTKNKFLKSKRMHLINSEPETVDILNSDITLYR